MEWFFKYIDSWTRSLGTIHSDKLLFFVNLILYYIIIYIYIFVVLPFFLVCNSLNLRLRSGWQHLCPTTLRWHNFGLKIEQKVIMLKLQRRNVLGMLHRPLLMRLIIWYLKMKFFWRTLKLKMIKGHQRLMLYVLERHHKMQCLLKARKEEQ